MHYADRGKKMTVPEPYAYVSHRQDAYSGAHIRAVSAAAGCGMSVIETDNDKIDYLVSSRVCGTYCTKPTLAIQAKCFMSDPVTHGSISYSIDAETYDSLRDPLTSLPRILVLVIVPQPCTDGDTIHWLHQDHNQSVLNHCAYWISIKNAPAITTATKTIHIPVTNIFTPTVLREMMTKISNGVEL